MVWPYILYLTFVTVAVVILIFLGAYAWQQHLTPGAKAFAWAMFTLAGMAMWNGLIVVTNTERETLLFGRLGYISVVQVPISWLAFVLQYTNHDTWLTKRRLVLVSVVPAVTLIAAWVNPLLPLIWSEYHLVPVRSFLLLDVRFGPLMWLFIVYTYALIIITGIMLARKVFYSSSLYRLQALSMIIAIVIPIVVNTLYLSHVVRRLLYVDFTPLGFALSGIVLTWGLFRYRLFDLGPLARDMLVEKMQEGVLVLDGKDRILDMNPAARSILGISRTSLLTVSIEQILPMWPHITAVLSTTPQVQVEMSQSIDAVEYQFEVNVSSLYNVAGEIPGRLVILHDITARKRVELQLRQRAQELEALAFVSELMRTAETLDEFLGAALARAAEVLQAAFISVYLLKSGTDILELRADYPPGFLMIGLQHRLGEGITGYVAATGTLYMTEDVTHDPKVHLLPEEIHLAAETALRSQLTLPLRMQTAVVGVLHVGLAQKRPFHDDEIRLATAVADILGSAINRLMVVERLEEDVAARTIEIRAEQEKLEIILSNVQDAIVLFGLDKVIVYVNRAFVDLTGYTIEDLRGRYSLTGWIEFLPQQDQQTLNAALADGRSWQAELTLADRNGRSYQAAMIVAPVHDPEGELVGYVSSHRDITWRKELDRARNQFMSNVSHQLRTPVANIKLYADLLRVGRTEEKRSHYIKVLGEQIERLEHMVQDIIEMTSLDSGKAVHTWAPLSWPHILEAVWGLFETIAETANLQLVISPLPVNLPIAKGDDDRLVQALAELVGNAIAFTPAGGCVTLSVNTAVAQNRPWLTVTVQDTGPGVPVQEQTEIFGRFYRGQLAASGHIPGTGLGLSIVKAIIDAHGGYVTLRSEVNVGSAFTCWLPVVYDQKSTELPSVSA